MPRQYSFMVYSNANIRLKQNPLIQYGLGWDLLTEKSFFLFFKTEITKLQRVSYAMEL